MSALARLIAAERRAPAQRQRLRIAALCAALVSVTGVALLGISGWFLTSAGLAGLAGPAVARMFNFFMPSASIRLFAVGRTLGRYGERLFSHDAAFGALARLRPRLFAAIARMPTAEALAVARGDATDRLIGDVDAVEARFVRLSAPWGAGAAVLTAVAMATIGAFYAPWGWLAPLALALGTATILGIGHRLADRMRPKGIAVREKTAALKDDVAALAEAAAELRCYGQEAQAVALIARRSTDQLDAFAAHTRSETLFDVVTLVGAGVLAAAMVGALVHAGAPLAAMTALAAVAAVEGLGPLLKGFAQRGRLSAAEKRIDALLNLAGPPPVSGGTIADPVITLHLPGNPPVVMNPGERWLVQGRSGAGKTHLIEQLLGLRPLGAVGIALGGHALKALPEEDARAAFAWAPQDAMLISGSVNDNLDLADGGDADGVASEANSGVDIEARRAEALDDAVFADVLRSIPGGADGWIGPDGTRLSGGERRRLALARAYCAPAPWLILDEPTEGLDAATEAEIIARLDARLKRTGQGLILISHRLAPRRLCAHQIDLDQISLNETYTKMR